jgi:hypothetical protein
MLIAHMIQLDEPDLLGRVDAASFLPFALTLRVWSYGIDVPHRGTPVGAGTSRDGAIGVGLEWEVPLA